jgi:curved DNA-binding protein CbpA
VTPDHYATLGVSPTSEDVVIRAAYLALMRRYHPDRNASAEAAERAQAITHAYQVLSNWRRRSEYDLKRAQMSALRMPGSVAPRRPRPSASALFAVAAVALLVFVAVRQPMFVGALPERLPDAPVRKAARLTPNPAALCRSPATADQIKRELFRRAAEIRGRDQAAFDRIAGASLIRINLPELRQTDANLGTVRCQAWVELDLPPGLGVLDGRRNLMADIRYTVKPGADGKSSVSVSNEGLIVTPLVTLAQVSRADDEPLPEPVVQPPAEAQPLDEPPPAPLPGPPPPRARVAPQHARTAAQPARAAAQPARAAARATAQPAKASNPASAASANPSYSCQIAQGRGETAVCKSSDLSRLDRHLGVLYGQSWGQADAARRTKLLGTRDRFIARREACKSDSCISDAYVRRMREISDIMAKKN